MWIIVGSKFLWNNCRCSRSCQSKCILSTLKTLTLSHFSGFFEVELLLGVALFKIGDIWRTTQWRQEEAYPIAIALESYSWFKYIFEGLFFFFFCCVPFPLFLLNPSQNTTKGSISLIGWELQLHGNIIWLNLMTLIIMWSALNKSSLFRFYFLWGSSEETEFKYIVF